jgi:uncharacterized membrane protein YgcG
MDDTASGGFLRVLLAGAALALLVSREARAAVPPLDGHVTDPQNKLRPADEEAMEDKLGKIQSDTQVDVATWLSDAPPDAATELGNEAYERWHIGRDWENGVLLVFPAVGPVHVIMNPARPVLAAAEVTKIIDNDVGPTTAYRARIERAANEIGAVLRVGAKEPKPRPKGYGDPKLGVRFGAAAAGIAVLGVGLSFARRRSRSAQEHPTA